MAFARVYDAVVDDPRPKLARVISLVERYHAGSGSLLELGCGSGTMLAGLGALGRLTGIDRSPEMLAIARTKVPAARLIEGDITSCDLGERFDVVICVFDTVNHLTRFEDWQALFERAHSHLAEDGLFIFDVNTPAKLGALAGLAPWFEETENATVVQSVEPPLDGLSIWNVWIVERLAGGGYAGDHERIGELAVEPAQIEAALAGDFVLLEARDELGNSPGACSGRIHFACRRRERLSGAGR
jgi:SAM-dependent methyltransferase